MTTPAPGLAAPTAPAEALSARLALWFSCIGHAYSHLVTLLYLTVVLSLERDWGLGYAELLQLSALRKILADQVMTEQVIRPLVELNFGADVVPTFQFDEQPIEAFVSGRIT